MLRRYPSSQKGGTLICAEVTELETHEQWIGSGRYRPSVCPRCGAGMHIHDYRSRLMLGDPLASTSTEVARFRCARRGCRAIWQVLPAFLARCLWRAWQVVERVVLREAQGEPEASPIPARTRQRWRARMASSARMLVGVLATAGSAMLDAVAGAVGLDGTRRELCERYLEHSGGVGRGERLAVVAEQVHRLARGIRLV